MFFKITNVRFLYQI